MPEANKIIWTGLRFFGKRISIESFGNKDLDVALKSIFQDHYRKTAPLNMTREDVQLLLNSEEKKDSEEQKAGQMALFKEK